MEKTALEELQLIIDKLTAPDGCPWDKEQTPESLAEYVIEESHELVSAIRSATWPTSAKNWAMWPFCALCGAPV